MTNAISINGYEYKESFPRSVHTVFARRTGNATITLTKSIYTGDWSAKCELDRGFGIRETSRYSTAESAIAALSDMVN